MRPAPRPGTSRVLCVILYYSLVSTSCGRSLFPSARNLPSSQPITACSAPPSGLSAITASTISSTAPYIADHAVKEQSRFSISSLAVSVSSMRTSQPHLAALLVRMGRKTRSYMSFTLPASGAPTVITLFRSAPIASRTHAVSPSME